MKLFKTVDEKIAELGFKKVREDKYGVEYERFWGNLDDGYTQKVVILHKKSGRHILQSYDPNLFDEKKIGCTCVGLTWYELKLFAKKMKQIGLKSR